MEDDSGGQAHGEQFSSSRGGRDSMAAALVMIVGSLPVFLVGTLAVKLREFLQFDSAHLGVAVACYYLGAAVASVPFARVTDRIGAIRMMHTIAVVQALLLMTMAICMRSWGGLVLLLALSGMMSSGATLSTNQFLARRLQLNSQGIALGVKQAAVPFATLLGGLALPGVALTIGWRWSFIFAALVALSAIVLIPGTPTTFAVSRGRKTMADSRVAILPLAIIALGFGLGVFAANSLTAFLVTGGVTVGLSQGALGLTAALASGVAMVARVGLGYIADVREQCNFCIVAVMLVVGASGYVLIAIGSAIRIESLFIIGTVVALGVGWGWSGLFNLAVIRSHMNAPARATAVVQIGGRLGGVIGPVGLGIVADRESYTVAWLLASCTGVAGAAAILRGRQMLRTSGPRASRI